MSSIYSRVSPSNALLWAEFRTQFDVNGVRKCENMGRYPGAPRLLTLGDGTTASTIPAQITGRHGLVFAGTQYVDTGIVDAFERTTPFSLFMAFSSTPNESTKTLIANNDVAQAYRGITSYAYINHTYFNITNTNATNQIAAYRYGPANGNFAPVTTVCHAYSGNSSIAGVSSYVNREQVANSSSANNLSATIKNGKSFLIGARHNGAAKASLFTGQFYFAAIFPWELTPSKSSIYTAKS